MKQGDGLHPARNVLDKLRCEQLSSDRVECHQHSSDMKSHVSE